jgi:hypothetical protein
MIGGLGRAIDNLLGRGDAAVTVPTLDGALKPNRKLDEAASRTPLEEVDCLAVDGQTLVASAGNAVFALGSDGVWSERTKYDSPVTCLALIDGGLAVALANGEIVLEGKAHGGRRARVAAEVGCITAMVGAGTQLYVANGSATNGAGEWQRDLLERNASGSIWRLDLKSGQAERLIAGLAWPAGVAIDGGRLVFSEAWKHQLARIDTARPGRPDVLCGDLPAYPGRISPAADGYWLALFAPRSQLVEFVLREPAYRKRMMTDVPQPYWVAPKFRSGRSFYESLQGGGMKHLGMVKPWAPTMSSGLCVKLDSDFQPRSSLQSRADGETHGVTSVVEYGDQVFAAAHGDGVVVALPLAMAGEKTGADA